MKKRILSMLIALMLCFCARAEKDVPSRAIELYKDCLSFHELVYGDKLVLFRAILDYTDAPSAEKLLRLQAIAAITRTELMSAKVPVDTLSPADYAEYYKMELEVIETELAEASRLKNDELRSIDDLIISQLTDGIYEKSYLTYLTQYAQSRISYIECCARYDCLTANYMLNAAGHKDKADWLALNHDCPVIFAYAEEWTSDSKTLEKEVNKVLDETEAAITALENAVSELHYQLLTLIMDIENGTYAYEPAFDASGYGFLSFPGFLYDWDKACFVNDSSTLIIPYTNDGGVSVIQKIEDVPDSGILFAIISGGVSESDYVEYLTELSELGHELYGAGETESPYKTYIDILTYPVSTDLINGKFELYIINKPVLLISASQEALIGS